LNLDFVNLGFGGAGKAETNVVQLVNELDACAFLFDLGKSYGAQPLEPYARMLDTIRKAHPTVPIFCVTPIYSTKEASEPDYRERSELLRTLMRKAAVDRRQAGDQQMFVVEGLELFGEADKDLFSDPLHPNDAGNERMARRLEPVVRGALLGKSPQP
jgi:lysophospholipase L1-like esterase